MRGSVKGPEAHAKIVRLFKKGWTLGSIARSMGVFTTQVTQVLEREGVRKPKEMPKQDWALERQVAELYESGVKPATIARRFKISAWRVYRMVRTLGVKVKPRGGTFRSFSKGDTEKMAKLWRSGVSQGDIAREFKSTQHTVSRVLRASGLDMSSRWRGPRGAILPKGGRIQNLEGYTLVKVELDDPLAGMRNSMGYVLEHRLVIGRHLGRTLRRNETVHHVNGKKTDNRIENLQLRQGRHGNGECHVCLDCGSRNIGATKL